MNNLANIGGGNANGAGIPIDGFTTPPHPITMAGRKTLRTPVKDTTFANVPDNDFKTPTKKPDESDYLMMTPSQEALLSAQKFVIPYNQEDEADDKDDKDDTVDKDDKECEFLYNRSSGGSSTQSKRLKINLNTFK